MTNLDHLIHDIEIWLQKIDATMPLLKSEIEKRIAELKLSKTAMSEKMGQHRSYMNTTLARHEISPEHLVRIGKEVQEWNTNNETSPVKNAE